MAELRRRRRQIVDRLAELRERRTKFGRGQGATADDVAEADRHLHEAREHAQRAHWRSAQRHDMAAEAHRSAAERFEQQGDFDRAQAHREAAERDHDAALADQEAAGEAGDRA